MSARIPQYLRQSLRAQECDNTTDAAAHSTRFSRLPVAVIGDRRLKLADMRVLAALCSYVDRYGEAFPSQDRLARDLGCSRRTILRAFTRLRKAGYVTSTRRKRERGGHWLTNLYKVNYGRVEPGINTPEFGEAGDRAANREPGSAGDQRMAYGHATDTTKIRPDHATPLSVAQPAQNLTAHHEPAQCSGLPSEGTVASNERALSSARQDDRHVDAVVPQPTKSGAAKMLENAAHATKRHRPKRDYMSEIITRLEALGVVMPKGWAFLMSHDRTALKNLVDAHRCGHLKDGQLAERYARWQATGCEDIR